jgi:DNA-binding NarL/FixJ family response regulator
MLLSLKKRIFIVEDQAAVREGIGEILNREPDLAVCGDAADMNEALTGVFQTDPDLVLADIQLGSSNGIELIRELRQLYPGITIIAMTMFDPVRHERQARAMGADGFVVKQEGAESLLAVIRTTLMRNQSSVGLT